MVAPDSDSIKFNSPTAVYNFFEISATILSDNSLVSIVMGASDASTIIDSILNAYTSAAVILCDSSSVVSQTTYTTPWMIRLTASSSGSINFNYSDTIYILLCAYVSLLRAPSLVLSDPSIVSVGMGAFVASVIFASILSASASASVIFFAVFFLPPPSPLFFRFLSSNLFVNKSM